MEIINPISADTCSAYYGKPVCAVLHDGSRVYGYLKSVENGRLMLANQPDSAETSAKSKKGKSAKTSGYYPYPPYGYYPGGVLALELALIALLFAVPFFW